MIFLDYTPGHLIIYPNFYLFSLFCFQPVFLQMAFLIGWCKENGNFIRKKHLQGAKFGHIPFFDQNTQPKQKASVKGAIVQANIPTNFTISDTKVTILLGFLVFSGQFCPNGEIHCFQGPNYGTIVVGSQFQFVILSLNMDKGQLFCVGLQVSTLWMFFR